MQSTNIVVIPLNLGLKNLRNDVESLTQILGNP